MDGVTKIIVSQKIEYIAIGLKEEEAEEGRREEDRRARELVRQIERIIEGVVNPIMMKDAAIEAGRTLSDYHIQRKPGITASEGIPPDQLLPHLHIAQLEAGHTRFNNIQEKSNYVFMEGLPPDASESGRSSSDDNDLGVEGIPPNLLRPWFGAHNIQHVITEGIPPDQRSEDCTLPDDRSFNGIQHDVFNDGIPRDHQSLACTLHDDGGSNIQRNVIGEGIPPDQQSVPEFTLHHDIHNIQYPVITEGILSDHQPLHQLVEQFVSGRTHSDSYASDGGLTDLVNRFIQSD